MITILTARGIGERLGSPYQMCRHVTQHLDPARFTVEELPVDITYGPVGVDGVNGASYGTSLRDAFNTTLDWIVKSPNPVVLLGYSGGAALMGNVAAYIGEGRLEGRVDPLGEGSFRPRPLVLAAALIADPHQPVGVSPLGHGVAGSRPIRNLQTWWSYSDRDPICVTPELSPLRTLADQSAGMSLADPAEWGADLYDRARRARWQPSSWDWRDPFGSARRIGDAVDAVSRYAQFHFTDYLGFRTEQLARQIEQVA